MNPDTKTPSPNSAEYLDHIATKKPAGLKFGLNIKSLLFIGAGLIVLIIISLIVTNVITSGQRQPLESLAARLASAQELASQSQANLSSSELRSANSNLSIVLTNTNRDIVQPLKNAGVNTSKLSQSVLDKESSEDITIRLEDARLNGVFDRVYAREMNYLLSSTIALIKELEQTRSQSSLLEFLDTTRRNLEPIQATLEEFGN